MPREHFLIFWNQHITSYHIIDPIWPTVLILKCTLLSCLFTRARSHVSLCLHVFFGFFLVFAPGFFYVDSLYFGHLDYMIFGFQLFIKACFLFIILPTSCVFLNSGPQNFCINMPYYYTKNYILTFPFSDDSAVVGLISSVGHVT